MVKLLVEKKAFEQYYSNNSLSETCAYFNISLYQGDLLLKEYQIPKHSRAETLRLTSQAKYGVDSYTQLDSVKDKHKQTLIKRYGSASFNNVEKRQETLNRLSETDKKIRQEVITNKSRKTKLEKYGDASYNNTDQRNATNLERYGVTCTLHSDVGKQKVQNTLLRKYGQTNLNLIPEIAAKRKKTCLDRYQSEVIFTSPIIREQIKNTLREKYGVENAGQIEASKPQKLERTKTTCLKRYGVEFNCLRKEAQLMHNDSKPNQQFAKLLDQNDIIYEREYVIGKRVYDFKIGQILIEINPSPTHNITWGPFGEHKSRMTKDYHLIKSQVAENAGYRCIHVWDWDNINKIITMLSSKTKIYARKCVVREISTSDCNNFLNLYHLQNTCQNQKIRLGLYHNNELVQIITFGKPRYNNKYEYELLRLCTKADCLVIGGSEKLYKYFIKAYNPKSIVSYCDNAKYTGEVYKKLNMKLLRKSQPRCHWYNLKTQQHVTDNLLKQRGFDQLFNADYGKGIDNATLMRDAGFIEIYDCGQSTYIWKNNN